MNTKGDFQMCITVPLKFYGYENIKRKSTLSIINPNIIRECLLNINTSLTSLKKILIELTNTGLINQPQICVQRRCLR